MKSKAVFALIIFFLSFALPVNATTIPMEYKKAVVFIYGIDNQTNILPDGTGFLVSVPNGKDTNSVWGYLVTAKHVLCPPSISSWMNVVAVRFNRNDKTSVMLPLFLSTSGPSQNTFTNDDPTVDIAVVNCYPHGEGVDFHFLPTNIISSGTDIKQLGIQDGSDVFFTGMFVNITERRIGAEDLGTLKRFTPITRFGKVSLIPDEKIDWITGKTEMYLMEANSYPGNSGSPVYFQVGPEDGGNYYAGRYVIKLAGIMSGCFTEGEALKTLSVSTNQYVSANNGIAGVVPAYKLMEILNSPQMRHQRHEQ